MARASGGTDVSVSRADYRSRTLQYRLNIPYRHDAYALLPIMAVLFTPFNFYLWTLLMNTQFNQLFYGRYFLRIFLPPMNSKIDPLGFIRYVRPQENGSKADVRWAALGDPSLSRGLLVNPHPPLPPPPPQDVSEKDTNKKNPPKPATKATWAPSSTLAVPAGESAEPPVYALHVSAHHFHPDRDFGLELPCVADDRNGSSGSGNSSSSLSNVTATATADATAAEACAKEDQQPRHGSHATLKSSPSTTTLRVDCGAPGAACGVGGVDSWGAKPMAQHLPSLPRQGRSWAFRLRAFHAPGASGVGDSNEVDLGALARCAPDGVV